MTIPKEAPMIEKCARAACDAAWAKHGEGWDHASDWQREEFRLGARAVLTALRDPTPEMVEAGERAAWDDGNHMPAIRAMEAGWTAMIDRALNEGEGHD